MEMGVLRDGYHITPSVLHKVPTLLEYPLSVRRFQRGDMVVRFQEPIRELQLMTEGRAKVVTVMGNGRTILHTMFHGFEVIGDLELLRGYEAATTNIQAITEVVTLCIPLQACQKKLLADTAMLRLLGEELAKKLERSSRQTSQNLLYPLSARLAAYLLFSAQKDIFTENLTHVSELMATSYRHLLRTLKTFCAEGAICKRANGYHILNKEYLAREGESLLWEK